MTGYQLRTDPNLHTNSKTVAGAINEVKSSADSALSKADTNATSITNITNGNTEVEKATNVTTNINGKAISSIFESNGTTVKEATHATSANSATTATTANKVANALTINGQLGSDATSVVYDGSAAKSLRFNSNDFQLDTNGYIQTKTTGVTAGTYSVVTVDAKGRATAGGQIIEWGTSGQTTPTSNLVVGGLFMKLKQ